MNAYMYLLELVCLLCGRGIGNLLSDSERPSGASYVPPSMRCGHCGGLPTFSGDVGRQIVAKGPTGDMRVRHGRPPKALIEARQAGLAEPAVSTWKRTRKLAGEERCSNCRRWGHHSSSCPRPRRISFGHTVQVPGTTVAVLSRPSKMPGPSWSIPAGPACPFMVDGPNTICGQCYATKGNYTADPNVVRAQWARFNWARECLKTADGTDAFVWTMVDAITGAGLGYMRVHDSGDLFSAAYTRAWIRICTALPQIRFWFPTRSWRAPWVGVIAELAELENVTVRPSALHFDDPAPVIVGLHAGTTASSAGYSCVAPSQDGACGDCRVCWLSKDQAVSYHRSDATQHRVAS